MFSFKNLSPGGRWTPLLAACVLAGCASTPGVPPQQTVAEAIAGRTGSLAVGAADLSPLPDSVGATAAAAPVDARIDAWLAEPLSDASAVRIALLRHPQMQTLLAELQLSQAEARLDAQLPNPQLVLARLREGDARELDRALRFDLLGLVTLPWRQRAAERAEAAARWQAAQRVLLLAAQARNAWVDAVAAALMARQTAAAQEAAELGVELGRRMVRAGNWSAWQLGQAELALAEARQRSLAAEHAAGLARERLVRAIGLADAPERIRLPERLPDLPAQLPLDAAAAERRALAERLDLRAAREQAQQRAEALGATRSTGALDTLTLGVERNRISDPAGRTTQRGVELELSLPLFDAGGARNARAQAELARASAELREVAERARTEARTAWAQWQRAHQAARHWRDELVPLRQRLSEETLLRYNGMLTSPWDVLTQAAAQSAAVASAIAAERDFWFADTELQLALTGTSPRGLERPSDAAPTAASATPTPQGH
ncbi:TolC family protein [Tibeticola sp.]|uniref:TolC family protein n=1 Tax=Tibeticola sp. TaxID=2005368 RepID=UPI002584B20F|nr:TolC family protein [Tibeticola sp.]MCI4441803.1 TolC family protein [Tibeticola sp.]